MEVRKNLVLGGSGTIGKALVKNLTEKGEVVINLDLKEGFDLRFHSLEEYKHVDYVWFLAWDVGGAKYLLNPNNALQLLNNNIKICTNVFTFLEKHNIPFLFASTQMVNTDNVYGLTKIIGEEYTKRLNGTIIRLWNVYGWEEPGEKSHVITDLVLQAIVNKKITLLTDGEEERQFIYISDCADNMIKAASLNCNAIDFTNNDWVKIKDVAYLIARMLDCQVEFSKESGYTNKIAPNETYKLLNFKVNLIDGIALVVDDAIKYLKSNTEG